MGRDDAWNTGECPPFLYTDPGAHAAAESMYSTLGGMCENQNPSFVEVRGFDLSNEQWAEAFRLLFKRLCWKHKPAHVRAVGFDTLAFGIGRAPDKQWHLLDPEDPMVTIKRVRAMSHGLRD